MPSPYSDWWVKPDGDELFHEIVRWDTSEVKPGTHTRCGQFVEQGDLLPRGAIAERLLCSACLIKADR